MKLLYVLLKVFGVDEQAFYQVPLFCIHVST